MAYLANTLWAGRLTGSSMNPVRSLPPALLSKYYTNLWVYIAGPIIGCSVGAVLYTYVFVTPDRKPRARKLTESGRSAEGESVRSEHDAHELMPLNHITPRHTSTSIVPTEALSQRDEGVTLVRAQHPAYYATMSQRSDVTQALYVQVPTSQQQPQISTNLPTPTATGNSAPNYGGHDSTPNEHSWFAAIAVPDVERSRDKNTVTTIYATQHRM
nr:neurogenic protein big brain-like [Ciona intestinalis]|eukprot:XP_002126491.1 neurogenic protein big brain-like [Ciona intestinalis]